MSEVIQKMFKEIAELHKDAQRYRIVVTDSKTGEVIKDLTDLRSLYFIGCNSDNVLKMESGMMGPLPLVSTTIGNIRRKLKDHAEAMNPEEKVMFTRLVAETEERESCVRGNCNHPKA